MKKVLITGGSGFLGVHLARFFLKKNYKVICLDIATFTADDIRERVEFVRADITNRQKLLNIFKNVDYVVHAAAALPIARRRDIIFKINVEGTKNVLEAALINQIKRLVFISSTAVYGVPKHLPETEDAPLDPIGHYGDSKIEGENLCLQYQDRGLSINIIRPKTFLGPERLGVFTIWFEAIYNNRPIFILGNGKNHYQLLDVKDLCQAIYAALICKPDGQIFNIAAEKFGTWSQDLGAVINHAESKSKIIGLPVLPSQLLLGALEKLNLSPIAAWHYKTLPVDSYVSVDKAARLLRYKSTKSNEDLLIESYDWYKRNRKKIIGNKGTTHRTVWNFKLLDIISKFS